MKQNYFLIIAYILISLIFGSIFLGRGFLTGNSVINGIYAPDFAFSLIGFMLIGCSGILIYFLNRK